MLRRDVVPTRDFRYDGSGRIRFRDDPALVLRAPPAPAPNPDADIDPTTPLRSVNYMVNHICQPISPKSVRILSLSSSGATWGQRTAYIATGDSVTAVTAGGASLGLVIEVVLRNGRVLRVPEGVAPARAVALADALEAYGR
jgi:hypothetical protein